MGPLTNIFINIFTVSRSNSVNAIPVNERMIRYGPEPQREGPVRA